MTITLTQLVYFGAAVWRLAHLFANEDGPFYAFKTLRSKVARAEVRSRRKNGFISRFHLYELINCEYCNSIWFGAFFTLLYVLAPTAAVIFAFPLALSTVAIFFKKVHFVLAGLDTRLDKLNNPVQVVATKQPLVNKYDQALANGETVIFERKEEVVQ